MLTVWKYHLGFESTKEIEMPDDAEILFVGNQAETLCMWVRVNIHDITPYTKRRFLVRGTGQRESQGKYIGSATFAGGNIVAHVFEDELK